MSVLENTYSNFKNNVRHYTTHVEKYGAEVLNNFKNHVQSTRDWAQRTHTSNVANHESLEGDVKPIIDQAEEQINSNKAAKAADQTRYDLSLL